MLDIKFLRENPDIVKENIKNKFQEQKLVLVDEVIELDKKNREVKLNGDNLRSERKNLSAQIGGLMKNGQKEEAEKIKLVTTDETINKLAKYIHNVLGLRELNCNYDINQEKCRSCIKRTSKKI